MPKMGEQQKTKQKGPCSKPGGRWGSAPVLKGKAAGKEGKKKKRKRRNRFAASRRQHGENPKNLGNQSEKKTTETPLKRRGYQANRL